MHSNSSGKQSTTTSGVDYEREDAAHLTLASAHRLLHRGSSHLSRTLILVAAFWLPGCDSGSEDGSTSPPPVDLPAYAASFPPMPLDTPDLPELTGETMLTFSSGVPFNDLEYTLYDNDFQDGETTGYDTFLPVDPSDPVPGADTIKLVRGVSNVDLDAGYDGARGDRIILGTAEIATPFFARGADGTDNDYAVISNLDYTHGHIQLRGSREDYRLLRCTTDDGCATTGNYLFHTAGAEPDLIAFIFPCDVVPPPLSGVEASDPEVLCNASKSLSLSNDAQFRFAQPVSTRVAEPDALAQFGSNGREIVGGLALDDAGAVYVFGQTDGDLDGQPVGENALFIRKLDAAGQAVWTTLLELPNSALLFDGVTDAAHLYVAGRTFGALPGFSSGGRYDGILLKLRLDDGSIVASDQFGNRGLDGYGNVILDDSGHLYVSAQGSPAGETGTDGFHLIAKHRTSDLSNVWRILPAPPSSRSVVSEAWGGLSYIPGATPGDGRLIAAGWLFGSGVRGAGTWVQAWEDLTESEPRLVEQTLIDSPGLQADWILDNTVDAAGNVYVAGFTTGDLGGPHQGDADAFIARFSPNLDNPVFRQIGTPQADAFRKLEIGPGGVLTALGYSYGDWPGTSGNADRSLRTGDVVVARFAPDLTPLVARQFGTPHEDRGMLATRPGIIAVAGTTEAALGGTSAGSFDAFVLRLNPQSLATETR